jgi:hypothetical protein
MMAELKALVLRMTTSRHTPEVLQLDHERRIAECASIPRYQRVLNELSKLESLLKDSRDARH